MAATIRVVPATRSPFLVKEREETVTLLKHLLAPENVHKIRGDYKVLAELTLVLMKI
jgi:hypothetical protein